MHSARRKCNRNYGRLVLPIESKLIESKPIESKQIESSLT